MSLPDPRAGADLTGSVRDLGDVPPIVSIWANCSYTNDEVAFASKFFGRGVRSSRGWRWAATCCGCLGRMLR